MAEMDERKITVFSADGLRRVVVLTGTRLSLGRTPDNDLVLDDPQVSRRHAELRVERETVLLTDVGSTNGTFVEEQRLAADSPIRLLPGVEVRIGAFVLILHEPETKSPIPELPAPEPEPEPAEPFVPVFATPSPNPEPAQTVTETPLPTSPVPLPVGVVSQYLRDLPAPLQESDFLGRFLLLFESVWEPMEQRQDHIAFYFDPRTCPATFLPYLAEWIGVELAAHWSETRKRRLLREAAELYRWRGTTYGLVRFIELAINVAPTVTEADEEPFTIRIVIPAAPGGGAFTDDDRDTVRRVIERHKPAHVGYYLTWT